MPDLPDEADAPAQHDGPERVRRRLDLDDIELVPEQTTDDTDEGWSSGSSPPGDKAAELRRYLDEKPPHHGD